MKKVNELNPEELVGRLKEIAHVDASESDLKRENANVDGNTSMGMMLEYGSESSKAIGLEMINETHAKAHINGDIHIHDLDFLSIGTSTCTNINLNKLFKGGFSTGHGFLREPNSISAYASLSAIAIQSNQNDQHGGQSIPAYDYYLREGVLRSYRKYFKSNISKFLDIKLELDEEEVEEYTEKIIEGFGEIETIVFSDKMKEELSFIILGLFLKEIGIEDSEVAMNTSEKMIEFVLRRAKREIEGESYQAMESFVHNLNTMHSRAGAQTPFSSISFGTDITPEGRMVSRNLLLAQEAGLGNGEIAIFPISIFKVKDGVNMKEGDPNYDLFKLACRVSSKRLFPNFTFLDAPYNLQYYEEGNFDSEVTYMGCVDGIEVITYKIKDKLYVESFERAWNRLSKDNSIRKYGISDYVDLENVRIYDSSSKGFVACNRMMKNPDKGDWYRVKFNNGRTLLATGDHPLPLERGRVYVQDMEVGDKGFAVWEQYSEDSEIEREVATKTPSMITVTSIEFLGERNKPSYDVTTESDRFDVSGIQSHNCRTRTMANNSGSETVSGRGNVSFSSINLPRLGIKYGILKEKDLEGFYRELDEWTDMVVNQLIDRLNHQGSKGIKNFPFLMGQGVWMDSEKLTNDDNIKEVLKHGSLTVGFIGLAETLIALTGKHHGESEESQELGLEIIKRMRQRLDEASKRHNLNFALIGTPAEGLSGRYVDIDREIYGEIEGITDKEYYTNSFHLPVGYKTSAFNKINIEAPYHALTNGGHISYIELDGDVSNNPEAFEKIIIAMAKSGIGYGSINHPIDIDPVCGFRGVIYDECPSCGRKEKEDNIPFDRIRRITGYLVGTTERFNDAKQAEVRDRVKHV